MNIPNNTLISTVPAAAQLRRVSGFNPLKFLHLTTSEKTGQTVLKLDLPYKRLWFRLACPNGRMLLKPLRITDELAIYEAMVYIDKDDAEPLTRITSTATVSEAPDGKYIESAQDAALNEALENAGFGIQLCDLIEGDGRTSYGSEVILDANAVAQTAAAQKAAASVNKEKAEVRPHASNSASVTSPASTTPLVQAQAQAQAQATPPAPASAPTSTTASTTVQTSAQTPTMANGIEPKVPSDPAGAMETPVENEEKVSAQASPVTAPAAPDRVTPAANNADVTPSAADIAANTPSTETPAQASPDMTKETLAQKGKQTVIQFPAPAPTPVQETAPMPQTTAQTEPSATYTADMSVEEIVQRMTLDEAKAVVVTNGTCKGWTIAQVAVKRAPSLRYYVCSPTVDNVLKAAAQIMLDANQSKAG